MFSPIIVKHQNATNKKKHPVRTAAVAAISLPCYEFNLRSKLEELLQSAVVAARPTNENLINLVTWLLLCKRHSQTSERKRK